jgi:hypothetical protein
VAVGEGFEPPMPEAVNHLGLEGLGREGSVLGRSNGDRAWSFWKGEAGLLMLEGGRWRRPL